MKYEVPTVNRMANIMTAAIIPAEPLLVRPTALLIFIVAQSVCE
jgi:hypothetical protein